jgi:tetratricopeptide (TPR) repeat protein
VNASSLSSSKRTGFSILIVTVLVTIFGPLSWAQGGVSIPRPPSRRSQPSKPDPDMYYLELARLQVRHKRSDEAKASFAKALAAVKGDKSKILVLIDWGEFLIRTSDAEGGRAKIEAALKLTKDERMKVRLLGGLARAMEQKKDWLGAAKLYSQIAATSKDPWGRRSAERQALQAYKRAGKLGDIIVEKEAVLVKDPKDEAALRFLLSIYTSIQRDRVKALAICEKLVVVKPDDKHVCNQLADLYMQNGKSAHAIAIYKVQMKADPKQASYYTNRITDAYLLAKENDKALEWAQKYVEASKKSSYAWSRLGDVYLRVGKKEEAVGAFKSAVALGRTSREKDMANLRLGSVYEKLKKDDDAIAIYKTIAATAKNDYAKRQAKRKLFDLYERKGMLDNVEFGEKKDGKKASRGM